jgi:hypothetical protein
MAERRSANNMTQMRTHNMANIGAVAVIVGGMMNQSLLVTTIAQLAAILTDKVIDRIGHSPSERHPGIMKRTPITHSIITAPVWAIGLGLIVRYGIDTLRNISLGCASTTYTSLPNHFYCIAVPPATLLAYIPQDITSPIIVASILAAVTHLFLDSITEAGIYFPHIPNTNEPRLFIRWRLDGIRHDDPGLSMSVSLLSLLVYAGYLLYGNPALAETFTSLARGY